MNILILSLILSLILCSKYAPICTVELLAVNVAVLGSLLLLAQPVEQTGYRNLLCTWQCIIMHVYNSMHTLLCYYEIDQYFLLSNT